MDPAIAKQIGRFVLIAITILNGFLLIADFAEGFGAVTYINLALFIGAFIFLCYAMFIQVEEEISMMFVVGVLFLVTAVLLSAYPELKELLTGEAISSIVGFLPIVPKLVHGLFVIMGFTVLRSTDDTIRFTWKLSMICMFLSILSNVVAVVFQRSVCSADTQATVCHLALNLLQQTLANFFAVFAFLLFAIGFVKGILFKRREPVF